MEHNKCVTNNMLIYFLIYFRDMLIDVYLLECIYFFILLPFVYLSIYRSSFSREQLSFLYNSSTTSS